MAEGERPEQTAGTDVQSGGELNAAITSAIVGIHHRYLGRGPTSASTFHHENVVVTIMHGVLTLAEETLAQGAGEKSVASMRQAFQGLMEDEFTKAVERLTGRRVLDFVSGTNVCAGVACEVFVLDSRL
jgi:uncharacterized protein YbcI